MLRRDITDKLFFPAEEVSAESVRIYGEDDFRHILTLERKRSERSLKPLLLLLVDVSLLADERNGRCDKETLLREVAGLTREIDLCGWYRQGKLVGVLFAEIPTDAIDTARDVISEKIWGRLSEVFAPEICMKLRIAFHLFPQRYDGKDEKDSFTLPFYPELAAANSTGRWAQLVKRSIDLAGSLAALVLFAPFFVVIPILIKLTSPGPVFFKQKRLGQFGKTFTFLKFRSMQINNDDEIHRQFIKNFIAAKVDGHLPGHEPVVYKIQHDPRLTPIGNFLRKSSLDEIPQFFNVLKGDMSLVGPRPPIPYEVINYELWHRRRILMQKPGITGLWQVTGRSLTTFDGMVRLDLRYSRTWSPWLDIKLLLATPLAVVRGKGAY